MAKALQTLFSPDWLDFRKSPGISSFELNLVVFWAYKVPVKAGTPVFFAVTKRGKSAAFITGHVTREGTHSADIAQTPL